MSSKTRLHRTLINIISLDDDSIKILIPSWNCSQLVDIPASVIDYKLTTSIKEKIANNQDICLIAYINTGVDNVEDLTIFVQGFGPELDNTDGLGDIDYGR